jgi:hypothetical protein
MATLHTKIKLYLEANGKTADEMRMGGTIQLASDGTNETIESWNLSGVTKPTDSQIASYETAANTEESNEVIRQTRKTAYGDIGEQLDEIYKDIDAWKTRIKKVKDDNPKG